jgi:hypothetical protein
VPVSRFGSSRAQCRTCQGRWSPPEPQQSPSSGGCVVLLRGRSGRPKATARIGHRGDHRCGRRVSSAACHGMASTAREDHVVPGRPLESHGAPSTVGLSFSFEAHLIDPKPQRELATAVTSGMAVEFSAAGASKARRRGETTVSSGRWERSSHRGGSALGRQGRPKIARKLFLELCV